MEANPILGIAGSMATTLLNNRMSQENATTSYNRQKDLMDIQNSYNVNNAMNMPGIQAFGLKQAGFNPAMVHGAGTQSAPTVSQGNADMAQTFPFNSQDALLMAQMENIKANTENVEADTDKKKAETEVIPTEGEKNAAQVLLYGKQAELTEEQKNKVKEEAQKIANENKNYITENERLKSLGQVVAQEWIKSDWYHRLPSHMKGYIEELASGKFDLTIGDLKAFDALLTTQGNISDKSRASMENTVLATIAKKQLINDESLTAIANLPIEEYRLKSNLADKTREEITQVQQNIRKIQAEIGRIGVMNQLDETQMNKLEADIRHIVKQIEQINENDYGILIKNGREGKLTAIATLNNLAAIIHTLGMFSPGGLIRRLRDLVKKDKDSSWEKNVPEALPAGGSRIDKGDRPNINKSYDELKKEGKLGPTSYNYGVQSMRFA